MDADAPEPLGRTREMIRQGDVYWLYLGVPRGSEPGLRRPVVVIQNDLVNRSHIHTIVVCAITSNLKHARAPGNVLLKPGEANLRERSVVNVSQISAADRDLFDEPVGALSPERLEEVLAGIRFLIEPMDIDR